MRYTLINTPTTKSTALDNARDTIRVLVAACKRGESAATSAIISGQLMLKARAAPVPSWNQPANRVEGSRTLQMEAINMSVEKIRIARHEVQIDHKRYTCV